MSTLTKGGDEMMNYKKNDNMRVEWDCFGELHSFSGVVKLRKDKLMLHNEKADFWLDLSSEFLKDATPEVLIS